MCLFLGLGPEFRCLTVTYDVFKYDVDTFLERQQTV